MNPDDGITVGAAHLWQVDCNRSLQPLQLQPSVPELDAAPTLPLFGNAVFKSLEFPCTVATLA